MCEISESKKTQNTKWLIYISKKQGKLQFNSPYPSEIDKDKDHFTLL